MYQQLIIAVKKNFKMPIALLQSSQFKGTDADMEPEHCWAELVSLTSSNQIPAFYGVGIS